jgi:NADP-dependent 3-hydroxy acid dehydrogenase YdfG
MRTALITGSASGFGFHLTERLIQLGWEVFATDIDAGGLDALTESPRLIKRRMDVRDPVAVSSVCAEAEAIGIDLLVNDAGHAVFGTQEEADLSSIRDLFEVNVLGVARVTQALLPPLRRRAGTIVNVSSVAGRTVFPESGFYAASKHAVEAITEALAQEVCPDGVRVRLIEPGSFQTGFQARAARHSRPRSPESPYVDRHHLWDQRREQLLDPPGHPSAVADAIVASLDHPAPFLRVPVGPDALRMLRLREQVSADAWTRLAITRNGGPTFVGVEGDVLTPEAVVAASREALTPTLAAWKAGHLRHWEDSAAGQAAIARLRNIG